MKVAVRAHHITVDIVGKAQVAVVLCTCTWRIEIDKGKALRYAAAHLREVGE